MAEPPDLSRWLCVYGSVALRDRSAGLESHGVPRGQVRWPGISRKIPSEQIRWHQKSRPSSDDQLSL